MEEISDSPSKLMSGLTILPIEKAAKDNSY